MEEYRDEYNSFEGTSKFQEIVGIVFGVCFFGGLSIYYVYDLIGSAPVYSSVLGFVSLSAVVFYVLFSRPLKSIDILERRICKRLDKQGYPHEKHEGTLYVTKNDHHFRVQLTSSCDNRIKHLCFEYEFRDDIFEKVSMEGWTRVANSINVNNVRTTFVVLEDHFSCCYQTAICNAKNFMNEFDLAYLAISEAISDYKMIYPFLERDYPHNTSENKSIMGLNEKPNNNHFS